MTIPGVEARSHSRVKIQAIPIQGDKNPAENTPNWPIPHTPAHVLGGNTGISASPCQGEVMHRFISLHIYSPLKFSPANKFWNRLGSPFTKKKKCFSKTNIGLFCFFVAFFFSSQFSCLLRTYFPSLMPNKSQLFPTSPITLWRGKGDCIALCPPWNRSCPFTT